MELIANIFTAILSKQLTDELRAWTPKLIRWLIDRAVRRLPEHERDRYLEEWHSHINEVPGEIGKIVVAIRLLSAARQMSTLLSQKARETDANELATRILAFLVATFSVVFVTPALLLVALIIKLESRGPCFYLQERIGRKGRKFWLYSFRTFERLELESEEHHPEPPRCRTTRFGWLLRSSHLDQIPNLFSVIRGDMALVGPRPHRPEDAEMLFSVYPNYKEILKVKPGMTGLAQVTGSRSLKEWIDLDLYYVENRSLNLDLNILARTASAALFDERRTAR